MSTIHLCVEESGGIALAHVMASLFEAGWETLEPLRWCAGCRCYFTTFYR